MDVDRALRWLDDEFAEKERLSDGPVWEPVPRERKVSTVRDFYRAFHDTSTMPIHACRVCYIKFAEVDLEAVDWDTWIRSSMAKPHGMPSACPACFVPGELLWTCVGCKQELEQGSWSVAAQLHRELGCEHMYPPELKHLSPVEEKLIALNSPYGFITKYSASYRCRRGISYPRHVKGHITVFPNNVQELASNVLPHPLVRVMDEIHVSWQGAHKPAPSDLSRLLCVRRGVVERALVWLRCHNPLYGDIQIDEAELASWEAPAHGVPPLVYDRLERNEPSAREQAQTGHVVPSTERGLEEEEPVEVDELLAALRDGPRAEAEPDVEDGPARSDDTHEYGASGMFGLDGPIDVDDGERLRYLCTAIGASEARARRRGDGGTATAAVPDPGGDEPFIAMSRGDEFADSFDEAFLAKTFPTLFPFGRGGPRRDAETVHHAGTGEVEESQVPRDLRLDAWTSCVLRRHGGRFAGHPVFPFLVFNIQLRARNRRAASGSVRRADFERLQDVVRSMTEERLERARVELQHSWRTTDVDVQFLLKSLSLFGNRQPMSRENRMVMRRRIKSLIIRYGLPAIWFTVNPNDITNPVKLKLAAHRFHDPAEAEEFLRGLERSHRRARLAVSDPVGSAQFFHREVSLFFEHYVKTGRESVFGRIGQYYGAVESNERGSLHVHGLLWLEGNQSLDLLVGGAVPPAAEQDAIAAYIDSVFKEVGAGCAHAVVER